MNAQCNFITPPSSTQYESFKQWWRSTKILGILCGTTFAALVVVYAGMIIILNVRLQKISAPSTDQTAQTLATLQSKEATIKNRLTYLHTLRHTPSRIYTMMSDITAMLPSDCMLVSCDFDCHKECQLKGYTYSNTSLTTFINQLKSSSWCSTVKLNSLQQTNLEQKPLLSFSLSFMPKKLKAS